MNAAVPGGGNGTTSRRKRRPPPRHFQHTDLGNAERLVARHGHDLRYCHTWQKWLVWDRRRWKVDDTGEVHRRAKETIRAIYAEIPHIRSKEEREALARHAARSESAARIDAMLRLAASERGIPVRPAELDQHPFLLTVKNGTLNLRTGILEEPRRENLLTRMVSIQYSPTATCPRWDRFVAEVMADDEELVRFLQRAVGYTLTGSVQEQVLFFAIGGGSNGKSTFLRVLLQLLGDYGGQAPPDLLLAKRGDAHPTEQASLFGRRLAVCTEVDQGRALAECTVKQLTGGDLITARRMREDFWEFSPTHKIWIGANHKPHVRGTDHAIWRRIHMLPFDVQFSEDQKDEELPDKLLFELPGILLWAVNGCKEWQQDGLRPPASVRNATNEYRAEMDL